MPEARAGRAEQELGALLEGELGAPVPAPVLALAEELRRRHGPAVSAVLFYGSCLRKRTTEGVLDFYVVVDDYRSAHASRAMAFANALLPPNVFYYEGTFGGETLRTKYAVISMRDLQRGASPRRLDCRIWSRFSQTAALAFARDEEARRAVVGMVVQSCLTFVERALTALPASRSPGPDATLRFTSEELFKTGFRETYRAELRSERPETVRQLHDANAERYAAVARHALGALAEREGWAVRETPDGFEVEAQPAELQRSRLAWRVRRPLAKLLAVAGLVKTAFTFDDWVPYVLWKVERQTAVRVEVSDRQRRHPLIFGWPVVFRLLREGVYR